LTSVTVYGGQHSPRSPLLGLELVLTRITCRPPPRLGSDGRETSKAPEYRTRLAIGCALVITYHLPSRWPYHRCGDPSEKSRHQQPRGIPPAHRSTRAGTHGISARDRHMSCLGWNALPNITAMGCGVSRTVPLGSRVNDPRAVHRSHGDLRRDGENEQKVPS